MILGRTTCGDEASLLHVRIIVSSTAVGTGGLALMKRQAVSIRAKERKLRDTHLQSTAA